MVLLLTNLHLTMSIAYTIPTVVHATVMHIPLACGHYILGSDFDDSENTQWSNAEEWKEDFLFHLVCGRCGEKITKPFSAYCVFLFHGWGNWVSTNWVEWTDRSIKCLCYGTLQQYRSITQHASMLTGENDEGVGGVVDFD